ncbi:MAG: TIGR04255 family protein [Rhodothermaceae bacterium]|nr:TIGR04255 family protein [Rhodothermaceae bacterium]MYF62979.1 TIGR04255 family protein [Rhodothermaceae bacterium]MYI84449.1 TIGR04255 family protein [Rhodothermaceae bacterium]
MSSDVATTPTEPVSLRRRYKNPPIVEAVCEFHFAPVQDWDPTLPGKLHAELSDDYSGTPRHQKSVQLGVQIREGSPHNFQFGEGPRKVQLITEDEKRIVGVGPNTLSVHMLRPYQDPHDSDNVGWDEFRPRICRALDAYWKVIQPQGVTRIGIKYINMLNVPGEVATAKEYLRCALPEVNGLPNHLLNLMSQVEYAYQDGVRLILSQGKVENGFILDIDVIWESHAALARKDTDARIDNLRIRERHVFEAVITDKARELFDAF